MPTQVANGADLYYEEYGSGPDVVISAQNRITSGPEPYLELLAAAGTHVYSVQLRGFGRSSPWRGSSHKTAGTRRGLRTCMRLHGISGRSNSSTRASRTAQA